MDDAKLVGGSAADRHRLLQRMDEYLDANARFDWEKLQGIWSGTLEAVFFNLNGHTYKGREQWTRLWLRSFRDTGRKAGSTERRRVDELVMEALLPWISSPIFALCPGLPQFPRGLRDLGEFLGRIADDN